jgi:FkbM family methyltransferase
VSDRRRFRSPTDLIRTTAQAILPESFQARFRLAVALRSGEAELSLLRRITPAGGRAVDAGANLGIYSLMFSKICSNVWAFEPNPTVARRLAASMPENVSVAPIALGRRTESLVLRVPESEGRSIHWRATLSPKNPAEAVIEAISVPVLPLDSWSIGSLDIFKIDVEGFEMEVIEGATDTIKRCRPTLLVEIEVRHGSNPLLAADFLREFGYIGFFYAFGVYHPIEDFVASVHQSEAVSGGLHSHEYIQNFFFVPSERHYSTLARISST